MLVLFFFFFKQKTAYEMRISDWSSDVCSSDLLGEGGARGAGVTKRGACGAARQPRGRRLARQATAVQCEADRSCRSSCRQVFRPKAAGNGRMAEGEAGGRGRDRKSTRLNSSH